LTAHRWPPKSPGWKQAAGYTVRRSVAVGWLASGAHMKAVDEWRGALGL
jgi:hypothetical protein